MKVAVIMTTYLPDSEIGRRRLENAKVVARSLYNRLTPNPFLILSDDTGPDHPAAKVLINYYRGQRHLLQGPNLGVGASLNRALAYLDDLWGNDPSDPWAWIYVPDDFQLMRTLHLDQASKLLEPIYPYWYVRLDLPHPNLACHTRFNVDVGWWLELDYSSGGFVFATRPALISSLLHQSVGPFLERSDAYEVELDYSKRVQAAGRLGALVTSPPMGTAWEHLSTDADEVGRLTPWQVPAVNF